MYKHHFALFLAALTVTPALLSGAPHLSVQVGAYRTVEEANTQSQRARSLGAESVEIRKEVTGEKDHFSKSLLVISHHVVKLRPQKKRSPKMDWQALSGLKPVWI